ncbi:DNA methyltransferase [Paenisporosarcina sp. TG20]|uniref:DNA methyltransferase n=1 Tax=Paenisporosarcina sp. TG20 TaxID=1211706 RepID=UPI0002DF7907|nr:DNA methyltransferase [Paenisporosarcina sp. TG20]
MTSNSEQLSLLNSQTESDNTSVICLGMTFENEEVRREYFRDELRKKLPELKKIEGFPIGEDEDIIALSDPPYFTACPNPWFAEIVNLEIDSYKREPFVLDVSESKSDAIYNAHTYHTKVPYKAIMHYIMHYTSPGDVILDGFSGTGMTGVAANFCGDKNKIKEIGYTIEDNNVIDENGNAVTTVGKRQAILSDLSPIASFIASNYNSDRFKNGFLEQGLSILKQVEAEYGWMYETLHYDQKARINYVVWSDVHTCPSCGEEIVFGKEFEEKSNNIRGEFNCYHCDASVSKRKLVKVWKTIFDLKLNDTIETVKQIPVKINYTFEKKRYDKEPDSFDLDLLKKIEDLTINSWSPLEELPEGFNTNQPKNSHGFKYVHLFYTKRNLLIVSRLRELVEKFDIPKLLFWLNSIDHGISKRVKHGDWSFPMSTLSGTLYIPSNSRENNPFYFYQTKLEKQSKVFEDLSGIKNYVGTQSAGSFELPDNSIDYIFIDPPFGSNLMYSELNFLLESWVKVKTNNKSEAIVNSVLKKTLNFYKNSLLGCFKEYYRVLKPNRWITIEFSNSQASIWNSIQESIQKAGFIIANVSALDKQIGSHKAVTSTTAVKQDLVISAYKPSSENINKMLEQTNTPESAWTFVNQHLEKLPVFLGSKGEASVVAERTPRILFDRMVAFHVQNGLPVPISSAEFQEGVVQRFPMRDGMAFLESQVAEYDKKRTLVKEFSQMSLFVSDENSAIEWIRQQLMRKPQTRQDLHPQFMKEILHIAKHEQLPELDDLLAQNFLRFEGDEDAPNQIVSYLHRNYKDMRGLTNVSDKLIGKAMNRWYVPNPNKQADLEKLREKSLLREFENYVAELGSHKKKLRLFRTEAIRAGFKKAWSEKNYGKIVTVGDRLPETVILVDDKLLMYYDNAQVRLDM